MRLIDAGVLVCSHRSDAADHAAYRAFVEDLANGEASFGLAELVLERFVLLVTHPRIWARPTPAAVALDFAAGVGRAQILGCVTRRTKRSRTSSDSPKEASPFARSSTKAR